MHPQLGNSPQPAKTPEQFENLKLPAKESLAPSPEVVEAVQRHQARLIQLALGATEAIRAADARQASVVSDAVITNRASWKFDSAADTHLAVLRNVIDPLRDAEQAAKQLYPPDSKEARATSTALRVAIKLSEDAAQLIKLYPTPETREKHLAQIAAVLALSVDSFAKEHSLSEVNARKPIPISSAELKALQSTQLIGPDATVEAINQRGIAIAGSTEAPTIRTLTVPMSTVREHQLRLLQRAHATASAMYEQIRDPNYRAPAEVVPNRDQWKFDASSRTDLTALEKLGPAELEQRRSSNVGRAVESNIILPLRTVSREIYLLAPQNPKQGDHPYASRSFEGAIKLCGELQAELKSAGNADQRKAVLGELIDVLGLSTKQFALEHKLAGLNGNKPIPVTREQLMQLQEMGFEPRELSEKEANMRNEVVLKVLAATKDRR